MFVDRDTELAFLERAWNSDRAEFTAHYALFARAGFAEALQTQA